MKKFIIGLIGVMFVSAMAFSLSSCGNEEPEPEKEEDETNNLVGKFEVEGAENLAYIEFKANASAIGYDEFGESSERTYQYNDETKKLTIFEQKEGDMSLWLEFLSNDRIVGWTKENHTESTSRNIFKRLESDITFAPIIGTWRITRDDRYEQMSIGCKGTLIRKEFSDTRDESDRGSYTYEDNVLTWYMSNGHAEGIWEVLEITDKKMVTKVIKSGSGYIQEWTKIPNRN